MTTLENKRSDIITLAKGAEVDTYVYARDNDH